MNAFPFDHLTLAEVAECEALLARDRCGTLRGRTYSLLYPLLKRRHPPIYDPPAPSAA